MFLTKRQSGKIGYIPGGCIRFLALILLGLVCAGCGGPTIPPNVTLLGDSQPYTYSDQDWAEVLSKHVREGLVDYPALFRNPESLDRYYALLSVTGPQRTPAQFTSRAQKTAYWINAYNALVLCAVLDHYPVPTMYDLSMPRLQHAYRFMVDGRVRNLDAIEAEILKESKNDVRALLAMSRAAMGTPKLADQPMRPDTLERQLATAAAEALNNLNLLRIDHATQSILVWQFIVRRQPDFINYWKKQRRVRTGYLLDVLVALASPKQKRALQRSVGYTLRSIPFDRTLNRWSPQYRRSVVP